MNQPINHEAIAEVIQVDRGVFTAEGGLKVKHAHMNISGDPCSMITSKHVELTLCSEGPVGENLLRFIEALTSDPDARLELRYWSGGASARIISATDPL